MAANKKKISLHERLIRILASVGIAVTLWFMVNGNADMLITQDFNSIPITLTNVEALTEKNLVLADDKNYYLNLQVKGTDKNLRNVNMKEVTAEVDLSDIEEKGSYDLDVEVKGLANSVIISSMNPTTLPIEVDNIIKENLDVVILLEGKPANDLVVISAESLEQVEVEGPEASIARIDKITTTADVSGLESDTTRHLEVAAYDATGNPITDLEILPNVVKTEIILGKTKSVGVIPSTSGNPANGYIVTGMQVEPSKVLIGAKEALLNSIENITMDPIDVSGQSKTFTRDINLTPPQGCYFLDGSGKVKVTVSIESPIEKSFTIDKVSTRNLGTGLVAAKVKDSRVVVKLEGASSVLNNLNASQIEAFVDCANLGPGEYELPIQTNLSQSLIKSITPSKTTVIIE
ncbi:YbbR-like domain-containing protein [Acetobacterium sp.]|uniref:CdaR family protein n=1 Tax=Acetobacterium sp. TaxID=1872094 RepID=UPI0027167D73|nr:CdaR family protein [Acetobacterium sp.]MDO9493113.1 CdaR family protein [Acetobacterium sp.]